MFFYNTLLILILITYIPHLTLRGKWHKGLWVQLGFWPDDFETHLKHPKNIWIHAVSVGEVLAIESVVNDLLRQYPHHQIILSTVTRTGNELACEKFKDKVKIIYAPFDFSWVVKKFVSVIRPVVYIAAETEIWPNLYRTLKRTNVAILQINGRISDKSFKGYRRIKPFVAKTLNTVDRFCMQSAIDSERICALGADSNKIEVFGNLKFDSVDVLNMLERSDYGFAEEDIVWVAGSTHPGEEEIVLNIYNDLRTKYTNLKLILAPRHIERMAEVVKLLDEGDLPYTRLSERTNQSRAILLIDTIGHLRQMYSLADIVFVGKTLKGVGGQNILEPAVFAKPIIVGPHMENFKNIIDLFSEGKAVIKVDNEKELAEKIEGLIGDESRRLDYGAKAAEIMQANRGATDKTVDMIGNYIKA